MSDSEKTKKELIEQLQALPARPSGSGCLQARLKPLDAGNRPCRFAADWRCLAAAFVFVCFLTTVSAQTQQPNRVVILASYHSTMGWTESVVRAIESELVRSGAYVRVYVEYMDTKRFSNKDHYANLVALLGNKAKHEQYDVIITVDNNALLFLLKYRDELYPNVPIVFCGVDRYHDSMYEIRPSKTTVEKILAGHDLVTGVLEEFDHEAAIDVALRLHPLARWVILINDGINEVTYYPNLTEEDVAGLRKRFTGRAEFENLLLTESNLDQVIEKVRQRRKDSVVLLANNFLDIEANLSLPGGKSSKFWQLCDAPVYVVSTGLLGLGYPVGGYVNDGYAQGKTATRMALKILSGGSPDSIPIVTKSPNRYMFRHPQMKKFGISPADLPPGSTILDQPESFYYQYKGRIWAVIAIIVVLALMVVILSVNILRRKTAEEALRASEEKYRTLCNNIPGMVYRARADWSTEIVSKCEDICGYSAEQLGQGTVNWLDVVHPDDKDKVLEAGSGLTEGPTTISQEYRIIAKDGAIRWVADDKSSYFSEDGLFKGVDGVVFDVTERKQTTEQLEEERNKLQSIIEAMSDGLTIQNRDYEIIHQNEVIKNIYGERTGEKCYHVYEGKDDVCEGCPVKMAFEDGRSHASERTVTMPSGEIGIWENIANPIRDSGGNIVACLEIARNVTARRQAEKMNQMILKTSTDGYWVADLQGNILEINDAYCLMVGYSRAELLSMKIGDVEAAESPQEVAEHIRKIVDAGSDRFESRHRRKDGTIIDVDVSVTYLPLSGGRVFTFFRDITEHKKAEQGLKESEERYRALFEGSAEGILVADIETKKFKYANPAICRMLGYTEEQLRQMGVPDVHPKESLEHTLSEFEAQARGEKTLAPNIACLRKDGTIGYVDINTARLMIDGRKCNVGFFTDITEHKLAEEARRKSEEKYRRLVENLKQEYFFYSHGTDGIFTYMSPSMENVLGYTEQEFLTHYTEYLTDNPINKEVVHHTELSIQGKQQPPYEIEIFHKNGDVHRLEVSEAPVFDAAGKVTAVEGIAHDITERLRARQQLQEARDDLEMRVEQRTADLARVNKELRIEITERTKAEGQLLTYQQQLRSLASQLSLSEERTRRRIATDVHDHIGQNLAMCKIKLETLRESMTSSKLSESYGEISELISQTIDSSRTLTFDLSPPVLYELGFEAAIEWLVRKTRQQHGVSAEFEGDGQAEPMDDDVRVLLFQVVRELLVNVAKHARARNVKVWTQRAGDEIIVGVEDDGVGFDTTAARSDGYGTGGFGLFSIRERLGHIGGHVNIESEPKQGTRVTLVAPADHGEEENREDQK
jgi:PAS domain S-box-containing protein